MFVVGDTVSIAGAIDRDIHDVSVHIGKVGTVKYLEYNCGCGQTFPNDPMIGVYFDDDSVEEFWREELYGFARKD